MTADSFTKLSSGILASTVWQEPNSTRIVWITMLALADRNGYVAASIPGLAHLARVTLQEVEAALATFSGPDPYSRTPENEGRRIESVTGGWRLLNHGLYRARRDADETKDRKRDWDRQNRPSGHARTKESPTQSDAVRQIRPNPTQAEADTEKDQELGAKAPSTDKPSTDAAERLAQVTDEAIEAYNRLLAGPLSLPKASAVGIDKKRAWVRRSLKTIREVCRAAYGSERIEPAFWTDYFTTQAADDFIAGRSGRTGAHANWRPDFDYLTRPDVIQKAFERAAQ
jgi:hypothetical protein